MQTLTNRATTQAKGNQRIIGRLMVLFNKSSFTINRWIEDKDSRLTTPGALQILREETGLTDEEILEAEQAAA